MAGLVKLQDRQNHREPLTKPLGNKLFELRHVGKLNTRIFWFFMERRSIVLVHGIRSKGRKIPASAIQTSQARMHDWLERNKDEQDEF